MSPLARFITVLATLAITAALTPEPATAAPIKFKNLDVQVNNPSPVLTARRGSDGNWRVANSDKMLIDLNVFIRSKKKRIRGIAVQPANTWIGVWSGKKWSVHFKSLRFHLQGNSLGDLRSFAIALCKSSGPGFYSRNFRVKFAIRASDVQHWDVKSRNVPGFVRCI